MTTDHDLDLIQEAIEAKNPEAVATIAVGVILKMTSNGPRVTEEGAMDALNAMCFGTAAAAGMTPLGNNPAAVASYISGAVKAQLPAVADFLEKRANGLIPDNDG